MCRHAFQVAETRQVCNRTSAPVGDCRSADRDSRRVRPLRPLRCNGLVCQRDRLEASCWSERVRGVAPRSRRRSRIFLRTKLPSNQPPLAGRPESRVPSTSVPASKPHRASMRSASPSRFGSLRLMLLILKVAIFIRGSSLLGRPQRSGAFRPKGRSLPGAPASSM